jgi:uncharacterized membrane protein YkvA (DUF1232 family)
MPELLRLQAAQALVPTDWSPRVLVGLDGFIDDNTASDR